VNVWETASLIDFTQPADWPAPWDEGRAEIVPVSPAGHVALGESGLVRRPVAGLAYDPETHVYLGRVGETHLFAGIDPDVPPVSLNSVLVRLDRLGTELAMRAAAMAHYHTQNRFCPACGGRTRPASLGYARLCPDCQAMHFPRIDPAVIVAITDEHDRLLLGHHEAWPAGRHSVFAGFAEAGESLENTVAREVAEEVGLEVRDVRYFGSQPWPMPRSLMIAFTATATARPPRVDGEEITSARWFTRAELTAALATGEVVLPTPASIAFRLITGWFGPDLPTGLVW